MTSNPDSLKTRWKTPFEWTEESRLPDAVEGAELSWMDAEGDDRFLEVVASSLADSLDVVHAARVAAYGLSTTARHLLDSVSSWGCSRESDWWKLVTFKGDAAGFVMPTVYEDADRDGRHLGTIFHIGVLPSYRGRGFGRLLLREATRTLMSSGTYRIFCDTDTGNAPMIHLFESEGWTRLANREVPFSTV
ncbi:MAG: GNAT family N-acetyltransferase [Acidimicrobiales bacterium]